MRPIIAYNSTYAPYRDPITTDLSPIVSKYFPDGMKSAGDVHDEIDLERGVAVQRVGSVDLGTLKWNYYEQYTFFTVTHQNVPSDIKYTVPNGTENWMCAEYEYKGMATTDIISKASDYSLFNYNDLAYSKPLIRAKNTQYTSPNEFKNSMAGVMLYYELAEPIETPIDPADLAGLTELNVEAGGLLTFANQHGDDYRVPLPNQETFMIKLGGAQA